MVVIAQLCKNPSLVKKENSFTSRRQKTQNYFGHILQLVLVEQLANPLALWCWLKPPTGCDAPRVLANDSIRTSIKIQSKIRVNSQRDSKGCTELHLTQVDLKAKD
jgi:hypothetical protein